MSRVPSEPKQSPDYPDSVDNQANLKLLETLQERLSREEAAEYIAPLDSKEKLQQLEVEKGELEVLITSIASGSIITGLTASTLAWLGLLLAWKPTTRLEKINRLIKLINLILENFEGMGVEILPLIKVPGYDPIDLFVRFPGQEFLLFAVRSFGESIIVYNESKQQLYYKRKKGLKAWTPDPLTELSEQAYWLKKNKRSLFGKNSKGVRKPMAKVLICWNKTQLAQHNEHLYATIGGKKFLFISRQGGACFLIHSSQVIEFIQAWLLHRQEKEKIS